MENTLTTHKIVQLLLIIYCGRSSMRKAFSKVFKYITTVTNEIKKNIGRIKKKKYFLWQILLGKQHSFESGWLLKY